MRDREGSVIYDLYIFPFFFFFFPFTYFSSKRYPNPKPNRGYNTASPPPPPVVPRKADSLSTMLRSVDMFRRQVITMAHRDIPTLGIYLLGSVAGCTFAAWAAATVVDFQRKTNQARSDGIFSEQLYAKWQLKYINRRLEVAKMDLAKLRARQVEEAE